MLKDVALNHLAKKKIDVNLLSDIAKAEKKLKMKAKVRTFSASFHGYL